MAPLTPYDIHNKEFKRVFRGYDVDEVNDFLDQIIKDFELLTREKIELEQQVEDLQIELERLMDGDTMFQDQSVMQQPNMGQGLYPQHTEPMPAIQQPSVAALSSMEQSIHKSIRVAQEVADEVRLNAKKESELIIQEAEKNADRIVNDSLAKARTINTELLDLKQKATIYRSRFRTLVQSHLAILENSDWESLTELEKDVTNAQFSLESEVPVVNLQEETTSPNEQVEYQESEENKVLEEVAATQEDEPKREIRRTRKLKRNLY